MKITDKIKANCEEIIRLCSLKPFESFDEDDIANMVDTIQDEEYRHGEEKLKIEEYE